MSEKSRALVGVLVLAAFVGTLAVPEGRPREHAGKEIDGAVKKLTKQIGWPSPRCATLVR